MEQATKMKSTDAVATIDRLRLESWHVDRLIPSAPHHGFTVRAQIIWAKERLVMSRGDPISAGLRRCASVRPRYRASQRCRLSQGAQMANLALGNGLLLARAGILKWERGP
jgi:hypothetical protein